MPFKELAFFADVKRKVVKSHRHTITALKGVVIFTKVRAKLLCLKTFEFLSFYTQKKKNSFLQKRKSDVITTVLVQLKDN